MKKLNTLDELRSELREWLSQHPQADTLSGSKRTEKHVRPWASFYFEGVLFRLNDDTKRTAVERFLGLCDQYGSTAKTIRIEETDGGRLSLRLIAPTEVISGWYCYQTSGPTKSAKKAA